MKLIRFGVALVVMTIGMNAALADCPLDKNTERWRAGTYSSATPSDQLGDLLQDADLETVRTCMVAYWKSWKARREGAIEQNKKDLAKAEDEIMRWSRP